MPNMNAPDFPVTILPLESAKLQTWIDALTASRGIGETARLSGLWDGARDGGYILLAAWRGEKLLGHIALRLESDYAAFRHAHIPEIVDLWVQPDCRNNGIATALLHAVENAARLRHAGSIGLAVGVTHDYGAAHRLYARCGFCPDGTGLWAAGKNVAPGEKIICDETALMIWIKTL